MTRLKIAVLVIAFLSLSGSPFAAEAPATPDPLTMCRSDLAVTGQYALQMQRYRTLTEQDLARANAQIADLQAQIEALKKPAEKPAEPKK